MSRIGITHKQHGSTAVVVTIIILVAIIGVLGFLLWQNMTKDNSEVQADTPVSQTDTTNKDDAVDTASILVIAEWNVKGANDTEGVTLDYTVDSEDSNVVWLNSKEMVAIDQSCVTGSGIISRFRGTDNYVAPSGFDSGKTVAELYGASDFDFVKVNEYYYLYNGPQALCYESGSTDLATDTVQAAHKLVSSLQER